MDRHQKKREKEKKEDIVKEFEKIELKHRIRDLRSKRTEQEKIEQNLKAKEGMKDLREKGRIKPYKERKERNISKEVDWRNFMRKSRQHADMAEKLKPDIVQVINEKNRKDTELIRQKNENKEREKSEEIEDGWIFSAEYGEYIWVGDKTEQPLSTSHDDEWTPPTKEELKVVRYEEERWCEEIRKQRKEKAATNRKKKLENLKKAMNKPVIPPPQSSELSEYEKLRNNNIKKIELAMKASGFFDDLIKYKKDIGLLK